MLCPLGHRVNQGEADHKSSETPSGLHVPTSVVSHIPRLARVARTDSLLSTCASNTSSTDLITKHATHPGAPLHSKRVFVIRDESNLPHVPSPRMTANVDGIFENVDDFSHSSSKHVASLGESGAEGFTVDQKAVSSLEAAIHQLLWSTDSSAQTWETKSLNDPSGKHYPSATVPTSGLT